MPRASRRLGTADPAPARQANDRTHGPIQEARRGTHRPVAAEILRPGHRRPDGPGTVLLHRSALRRLGHEYRRGGGHDRRLPLHADPHGVGHVGGLRRRRPDLHPAGRKTQARSRASAGQRRLPAAGRRRVVDHAGPGPADSPAPLLRHHGDDLRLRPGLLERHRAGLDLPDRRFRTEQHDPRRGQPQGRHADHAHQRPAQCYAGADLPLRFPLGHERGGAGDGARPGRLGRLGAGLFPLRQQPAPPPRGNLRLAVVDLRPAAGHRFRPRSPCKSPTPCSTSSSTTSFAATAASYRRQPRGRGHGVSSIRC